jgi:hypothetical protein
MPRRALARVLLGALLGLACQVAAPAQRTDFKIYPGNATQFDQTCTSFTSRCALGAAGGEYLQEVPMGGRDTLGNTNDFYRGIGQDPAGAACSITNIYFITQDQSCVDQETYNVRTRGLASNGSGPNTAATLFDSGPLLTPPLGCCGQCSWGINLALTTPAAVPSAQSWFVGLLLASNSSWVANGQSIQGSWYVSNTIGDVPRTGAGKIAWETKADGVTVGQCGTDRILDIGVTVVGPTLSYGNIHADPRCLVDPAHGAGGMWPSNTTRGDGLNVRVRDAAAPDGSPVLTFLSFSPIPRQSEFSLPGTLSGAIWIGPSPFVQTGFGTVAMLRGVADCAPVFLARPRLVGLAGPIWNQAIVSRPTLPLPITNAAATLLSATN